MSGMHRIADGEQANNIFRIKLFNGTEFHVIAPTIYEALELFKKHPAFDKKITTVTLVAKVDM